MAGLPTPPTAEKQRFVDRMNRYNYIAQHAVAITEPFDSALRQAVDADRRLRGLGGGHAAGQPA